VELVIRFEMHSAPKKSSQLSPTLTARLQKEIASMSPATRSQLSVILAELKRKTWIAEQIAKEPDLPPPPV
jgi:hypothetical protein